MSYAAIFGMLLGRLADPLNLLHVALGWWRAGLPLRLTLPGAWIGVGLVVVMVAGAQEQSQMNGERVLGWFVMSAIAAAICFGAGVLIRRWRDRAR